MADKQEQTPPRQAKDDPAPGKPKRAHRDVVDAGRHENKDTRRELREKH